MEYQKILNLLYNAQNEPSKFRTRNSVEINDESQEMYKDSTQIKFKTSIIRSNLCDCSDVYILVIGTKQLLEQEQMMLQNEQMKEIKH